MLADALRDTPKKKPPLEAVHDSVIKVCALIPANDIIVIDRLMRASEAVQARNQASYVQQEKALFEALKVRWPAPERETGLRLIAMLAIGAIRLSLDAFSREGGRRPIVDFLQEAFDALKAET